MKRAALHCSQAGFSVPSGWVCVSIRGWSSGCVTPCDTGDEISCSALSPSPAEEHIAEPDRAPVASEGQAQHSPDCVFREIQYHTIYICKIHLVFFPLRCLPIFQARGINGTEGQFVVAPCRMILNSCFIANISNFFRLRQEKKIEREKGRVWEIDRSYKTCCLFC